MESFDLAIIGAGPAGYEAAVFASKHGLKTALIEKHHLGGTCLNYGCIPTKTLLHTAELYKTLTEQSEQIGLSYESLNFSMEKLQARKNEVINQLQSGIAKLMKSHKVTIFQGEGQIIANDKILIKADVESEIQAKYILIATGSRPASIPIKGAELAINSDELLAFNKVYDKLIIIGGGVIGIEFAFLYAALGKKVVVIEAMDRILGNLDKEFAQSIKMLLKKWNVEIYAKAIVQEIKWDSNESKYYCIYKEKDAEMTVKADKVLMAVGRKANIENVFTDNLDIAVEKGKICVNEYYQTTIDNIYACGDVIGGVQLAHVATAEAINAVCHILAIKAKYDTKLIPSCIYTSPEIASVGYTLEEAKALGKNTVALKYPMGANGKSLLSLQERGFIKVVVDKDNNCLLGAQLMCARATDMISQFTQAIEAKIPLEQLQRIIFPHPTFSEGIGKVVEI